MSTGPTASAPIGAEALVERTFEALIGSLELAAMHIGERLGLYATLDADGPSTSAELAASAGVDERYAREWLEQQAVAGVLAVDDAAAPADARRYSVPAEHREPLLDRDSPMYLGAMPQLSVGMLEPIEQDDRGLPHRRGRPLRGLRHPHARGHRGLQPADVRQRAGPGRGSPRSPTWTPACGRPAGARRRHRLRGGLVERLDRRRLPERAGGRLRRGRPLDRGGTGPGGRARRRRTGCASSCRTRATRGWRGPTTWSRSSRRCTTCRGRWTPCAPRAGCWPRAAA